MRLHKKCFAYKDLLFNKFTYQVEEYNALKISKRLWYLKTDIKGKVYWNHLFIKLKMYDSYLEMIKQRWKQWLHNDKILINIEKNISLFNEYLN